MEREMKFNVVDEDGIVVLSFTDYGTSTKIVLTPEEAKELGRRLDSVGREPDLDLAAEIEECQIAYEKGRTF
jgi:hypothetical protein